MLNNIIIANKLIYKGESFISYKLTNCGDQKLE